MAFLPKDYKEPDTSNYMKLEKGDNVFRVLSDAITGMEYWKEADGKRKPVRLHSEEEIKIGDLETDEKGNLVMPKHFWAFIVFNRAAEKIQILEITQKTIRRQVNALYNNEKWGDPKGYDITITREGDGFETEYTVMPNPKEELDEGIVKLHKDMRINLDALYEGEDPFSASEGQKDEEPKSKNKAGNKVDPEDVPF